MSDDYVFSDDVTPAPKPENLPVIISESSSMLQMKAELDMQVSTAKAYPRNPQRCIQAALSMATFSPEIANGCVYAKPLGNREVLRGPSIRLAEIMISTWGNVRVTPRIVEMDQRFVTVETEVWDLESNVKTAWPCRRRLTGRDGRPYKESVIENTIAAATAISMRNATWKVIPKIYADVVYEGCLKIIAGDAKSLLQKVKAAIAGLGKMGVQEKTILDYFNVPAVELVDGDMLITLKGLGNAIKDGETTIEEAFSNASDPVPEPPARGAEALKNKLSGNGHAKAEEAAAEPKGLSDAEKAAIVAEERRAAEAAAASGGLDLELPTTEVSRQTRGAIER